ncbi:MAG: porin [Caulobacteraceae bacterium]
MTKTIDVQRASLLAGVAMGVLVAAGLGGAAQAKPARHHARPAGPSATELELKAQVEALQTQVHALETRLDAQAQAQQRTLAQAQAAQVQAAAAGVQAAAAQTQVQTAQNRIETLPGEVKRQVAAAAPKPGWWNNTTLGGRMFADVSGINNFSNGVRQPNSGVDYDIKRLYIIVDHKFNDTFSANVTTDFIYDSGSSATQLFIKKAYLQAKINDALVFRAGASDLPWVPFAESLYGYRYVEKTLIDRVNFGTSTDWGLHAFGTLPGGVVSYQVSVVDGNGFRKPATGTVNRTDAVDVEGRIAATYDHFTAGVGGYAGKLGHDVVGTPTFNTAERFDAIVAYVNDRIHLGGEYFWARHWNDVTQPVATLTNTSDGYGAFGSFNFTPKIAVFGRYDYVRPQRNTAPSFHEKYFNLGLAYKPIKPLDFALVYKRDAVDNGLLNTNNGVIGGSVHGTYDEIGLFSQVNF